jgi:hypothetical protein
MRTYRRNTERGTMPEKKYMDATKEVLAKFSV